MLRLLYVKEFVWFVPNDDNRIEDGKDLRIEFVDREEAVADQGWMRLGCSMLELLMGLSRRLAFETDGEPRYWFWEMIDNMGLRGYTDRSRFTDDSINEILDAIIWRTYSETGEGGIFPLQNPHEDQRKIELWYQMAAYVLERE